MKVVFAALAVSAFGSAAHAELVTLTCSGARTEKHYEYPFGKPVLVSNVGDVTFEVIFDPESATVSMDGKSMYVQSITDNEIRFSARQPSLLTKAASMNTYVVSRQSGTWRSDSDSGTGKCAKSESKKLF